MAREKRRMKNHGIKTNSIKTLNLETILKAYSNGIFPMAETKFEDDVFWIEPKFRGIIPLDAFRVSKSLKRHIQKRKPIIKFNQNFETIVKGCSNRKETWINSTLYNTYSLLNKAGYAQSIEVYENNKLTGGLFGININGAFFGESMYSISPNASKIALNFLIERLSKCHYTLFDTQFTSKHLMSLGAIEITQESYLKLLDKAINKKVDYAFY